MRDLDWGDVLADSARMEREMYEREFEEKFAAYRADNPDVLDTDDAREEFADMLAGQQEAFYEDLAWKQGCGS